MEGFLYWQGLQDWNIPLFDTLLGLVKALVFGFVITSIGCFYGFKTYGGAIGVGKSSAKTVVVACVSLIVLNFIFFNLISFL